MMTEAEIREEMAGGRFDFSRHAFRRAVERNIGLRELREAGAGAEMIEHYPDDKYAPSGLFVGVTGSGRPLHFQVSLADMTPVRIITVYEPDAEEWIDWRKRR